MQCPVDQTQLVMTERQGVEIDYCPSCRGIWLDRGELDKIIDRAAAAMPGASAAPPVDPRTAVGPAASFGTPAYGTPEPARGHDGPRYDAPRYDAPRYDPRGDRGYDGRKRKKKESWLEDLFDF